MTLNDEAKIKLANARTCVRKRAPYFSPALYGLIPVAVENSPYPMAVTDKLVLLYDPKWVVNENVQVLAFALAHEIMHVLLNHVVRGEVYSNKERWNEACDLYINFALRDWEVPDWAVSANKYGLAEGLSADAYYKLLGAHEHGGRSAGNAKVCAGKCGGIAGNPQAVHKEDEINRKLGRTPASISGIQKATINRLKEAIDNCKARGINPGFLSELIAMGDEIEKVPWQQLIQNVERRAIGRARRGGLDYSITRPSKRSYLRGWPIPGMVERELVIAVIIDSSASMSTKELKAAVVETAGVLRQTGVEDIWLLIVDTNLQLEPKKVSIIDLEEIDIPGRGGTDFRPGILAVQELEPRPNVTIYLTDGEGGATEEPPYDMEFIWGLVRSRLGNPPASWGEVVHIN